MAQTYKVQKRISFFSNTPEPCILQIRANQVVKEEKLAELLDPTDKNHPNIKYYVREKFLEQVKVMATEEIKVVKKKGNDYEVEPLNETLTNPVTGDITTVFPAAPQAPATTNPAAPAADKSTDKPLPFILQPDTDDEDIDDKDNGIEDKKAEVGKPATTNPAAAPQAPVTAQVVTGAKAVIKPNQQKETDKQNS